MSSVGEQKLTSPAPSVPIDCGGGNISFTVTTTSLSGEVLDTDEGRSIAWGSFECLYDHLLSIRFDLPDVVGGIGGRFHGFEACSDPENYGNGSPVPTPLPRCCNKENSYYQLTFKVHDDDSNINKIGYVMEFKKVSLKSSGSDGIVHFLSAQKSTSVKISGDNTAACQKSVKSVVSCSSVVAFCQKGKNFSITFGVAGSAFLRTEDLRCDDYFDFNKKKSDGILDKAIPFKIIGSDMSISFSHESPDNNLEIHHWALDYVDFGSTCYNFFPWIKATPPVCFLG